RVSSGGQVDQEWKLGFLTGSERDCPEEAGGMLRPLGFKLRSGRPDLVQEIFILEGTFDKSARAESDGLLCLRALWSIDDEKDSDIAQREDLRQAPQKRQT